METKIAYNYFAPPFFGKKWTYLTAQNPYSDRTSAH